MPRPFLVILCGIPSSGKSTLAREVAKLLESKFQLPSVIVSSDAFRHMIPTYQSRFEPELEQFIRNAAEETTGTALRNRLIAIAKDAAGNQSETERNFYLLKENPIKGGKTSSGKFLKNPPKWLETPAGIAITVVTIIVFIGVVWNILLP